MALIKNTPPEYFDKTIELLDQHFRDENYSEKAIYYDLAARCVAMVQHETLKTQGEHSESLKMAKLGNSLRDGIIRGIKERGSK